jgi:hypothetical protein
MPADNEILSVNRIWRIKNFLWWQQLYFLHDGFGQGNRAALSSWIQLSAIMVTVFKQLDLGTKIKDPILDTLIHLMGALFVDNTDMYTWREEILDPGELWAQTQIKIEHWSCLLNATGGALKPEKCWWYLLDYTCEDGEWRYADIVL